MTLRTYYRTILLDGKLRKLKELAELASKDRTPPVAKIYKAQAEQILDDLAVLDEKIAAEGDSPAGLDYSEDQKIITSIIRFLAEKKRSATQEEITIELVRGHHQGYKNERRMAIRVGRCVRAYLIGKPKENPKLKVLNGRIGLPEWPDEDFA